MDNVLLEQENADANGAILRYWLWIEHLMATLSFQRAISGGALGEGAAISIAMVPFLLAAILFSFFGLQRRAWQQGGADK